MALIEFIWIIYNLKSSTSKRKSSIAFTQSIWKAFIKKTQGLYKMQGLSMMSGDVDAILQGELFSFWREISVFQLFTSSWLGFLQILSSRSFPKFGVTLLFSVITNSSLGSSWSTQWSASLATRSVLQPFQVFYSLTWDCILFSTHTLCFTLQLTGAQFARVPGVLAHSLLLLSWIYKRQSDIYGSSLHTARKVSTVLCSYLEMSWNPRFRVPMNLEQLQSLSMWKL